MMSGSEIEQMEEEFSAKEIVWAKVRNYPWWPAEITALPTAERNVFKVIFLAEESHAFLNPRDVQKYALHYEENSKKKSKGLQAAIITANELMAKRQCAPKKRSQVKHRLIKKKAIKAKKAQSKGDSRESRGESKKSEFDEQVSIEQMVEHSSIEQQQQFQEQIAVVQESQRQVDRVKLQSIEGDLLAAIEELKKRTEYGHQSDGGPFKVDLSQLEQLSGQELAQSKISNMLSYMLRLVNSGEAEEIKRTLLEIDARIIEFLSDTSYYDHYIRLVSKNRKNQTELEDKLVEHLRSNYKLKKQIILLLANRVSVEIANGSITAEKNLIQDIKKSALDLSAISNKAAVDKIVESILIKYA